MFFIINLNYRIHLPAALRQDSCCPHDRDCWRRLGACLGMQDCEFSMQAPHFASNKKPREISRFYVFTPTVKCAHITTTTPWGACKRLVLTKCECTVLFCQHAEDVSQIHFRFFLGWNIFLLLKIILMLGFYILRISYY
jgi:hypothetical protein